MTEPAPAAGAPAARGGFVIRGGHVMTMDRDLGDIAGGDVHVIGGVIAAVGSGLAAHGVDTIDARGMIVLPGLVETHWHMWNSLLRCMSGEDPAYGYFRTSTGLGRVFLPDDMYQGTRLACAEAIYSGITSVHDWCHNVLGPEHVEAGLRALRESGLRGRFSYGWAAGQPNDQPMDLAGLRRLCGEWDRHSNTGLLSLGMAWRGPGGSNPAMVVPEAIYRAEIETARGLDLPVTVHACGPRSAMGQISRLSEAGLLGPDLQVVHANMATDAEIRCLAEAGAAVTLSPATELRIGYGFPKTSELLNAGIPTGLSVDTTVLAGNADMFAIMKMTQGIENARAESEFELTSRRALELATIEGARSMGMADHVGSLSPGKRADIIMVSTRSPNLAVFTDPAHMLVAAAQPANVDTVIVDGRVLKRSGVLTVLDPVQIAQAAGAALTAVRARAGWW
ncbi:MAG: amidohydrolase family protein [Micromonosporaceae bacterium]